MVETTYKQSVIQNLKAIKDLDRLLVGTVNKEVEGQVDVRHYKFIQGFSFEPEVREHKIYGDMTTAEVWANGVTGGSGSVTTTAINNEVRGVLLGYKITGKESVGGSGAIKPAVSLTIDTKNADGTLNITGLPKIKFSEPSTSIDRSSGELTSESVVFNYSVESVNVDGVNYAVMYGENLTEEEAKAFRKKVHGLRLQAEAEEVDGSIDFLGV